MDTGKDDVEIVAGESAAELMIPETTNPIETIEEQIKLVTNLYKNVLRKGIDYGIIPGVKKPSLLKPGAEKITFMFHFVPKYKVEIEKINTADIPQGHRNYDVTCFLYAKGAETLLGEGVGSCATLESKYRYRQASRVCPKCKKETIIKGKAEYGGGWVCFTKKGGCNAKFKDDDTDITGQEIGRVENPDIADIWNTVKKMAKKRAFVDATLTVSGVSDIFTQDVEDMNLGSVETKTETKKETSPIKSQILERMIKATSETDLAGKKIAFKDTYKTHTGKEYKGKINNLIDAVNELSDEDAQKIFDGFKEGDR